MKKIILMVFVLALYSFASAQDMKGMDMSKTDKSKKIQKKKTPVKATKKSGEMKNMKMPMSANKKDSSMKGMNMKDMKMDSSKDMKMNDMKGMKMDMPVTDKKMEDSNSDEMIADEMIGAKVNLLPGKTVRYDLYVRDTIVNFTGKQKHAYAINGSIPAPTLTFTEGDTAEIYLHNELKKEETSLHWHGVILPNRFDGVPYLTTARIGPGETHLYKFGVVQNGTYWYHSHSGLQEQAGMYGALIFKKEENRKWKKWRKEVLPCKCKTIYSTKNIQLY